MSYNDYGILKDVNEKPIPQYWNSNTGRYEIITSNGGKLRVSLVDSDGEYILTQNLVDQIDTSLQDLVRVVENIGI